MRDCGIRGRVSYHHLMGGERSVRAGFVDRNPIVARDRPSRALTGNRLKIHHCSHSLRTHRRAVPDPSHFLNANTLAEWSSR
jgi:hypothetical protein